ncbi:MAG: GldG family protein [Chloroflexota bacterium]|nr:GldG family protein [Chloroflexota bacterium]
MSEQEKQKIEDINSEAESVDTEAQEPFIPPRYLLILAGIGFLVALVVLLTQQSFTVVGFGGLAFGVLALIGWVLMDPAGASGAVSGRNFRFGGTSILVTILLLVAMGVIYVLVRNANIRADLTQRNEFSLSAESREAMEGLAIDPNIPPVRIYAFYGPEQAGNRDRDTLLFQEYTDASGGKIQFEFLDPDQNVALARAVGITRAGAVAVASVIPETGEPDTETAEVVDFLNQQELTNAILQVAAQGDFVAYILQVQNGSGNEMGNVRTILTTQFGWTVQDISLLELTAPEGEFRLGDEARDGEVLVIPGGVGTFTADELQIITNYLNNGGDLIVFAASSFEQDGPALAVDAGLNDYLFTNFGIRINNDLILDDVQAFQSPLFPVADTLDRQNYVTSNGIAAGAPVLLEVPHSITVSDTPPAGVTISRLIQTSDSSYVKADVAALIAAQDSQDAFAAAITRADTDQTGPVVAAAAADNTTTGARVLLYGSQIGRDDLTASRQIANLDVTFNSFVWTTNFENFFATITVQQEQRPEDTPIFATQQELSTLTAITQWLLPFGILGLGILVLYLNRERRRA